jgi:spermidine synthase
MRLSAPILFFLSFLLALCGLTYELVLAQILAATLGGTLLRYCTVIGIFTLSLGLGALYSGKFFQNQTKTHQMLFTVEILLSLLGVVSPFFIVFLEPFRLTYGIPVIFDALYYIPVVMIGALSGFELPLLISLCENRRQELQVLSFDYVGMFAGSLFVPLFLYPSFGPFVGSLWMSFLNLFGAALILPVFRQHESFPMKLSLFVIFFAGILISIASQNFWVDWIGRWFTFSF